jgi:hypothetical protein
MQETIARLDDIRTSFSLLKSTKVYKDFLENKKNEGSPDGYKNTLEAIDNILFGLNSWKAHFEYISQQYIHEAQTIMEILAAVKTYIALPNSIPPQTIEIDDELACTETSYNKEE